MNLMWQAENLKPDNVKRMRTLGTATRMMLAFQGGMETLQKIRSGGRQTVVVKHVQVVQVQEGGQAMIAGKIKGGATVPARKSRRK